MNVLDLEDHDVLYNGDVDGDAGVEYRSAGWCRNVRASAFKSFKVVRPSDTNHFTSLPCKVQLVMKIDFFSTLGARKVYTIHFIVVYTIPLYSAGSMLELKQIPPRCGNH